MGVVAASQQLSAAVPSLDAVDAAAFTPTYANFLECVVDEDRRRVERAIERLDRIIDMAMELQRPTAALKAMDMLLTARTIDAADSFEHRYDAEVWPTYDMAENENGAIHFPEDTGAALARVWQLRPDSAERPGVRDGRVGHAERRVAHARPRVVREQRQRGTVERGLRRLEVHGGPGR